MILEVSQKWLASLPSDLQQIVKSDGSAASIQINPWATNFVNKMRNDWVAQGGELIELPPKERAKMMSTLASVGEDVSKSSPGLHKAYETIVAAAKRARRTTTK